MAGVGIATACRVTLTVAVVSAALELNVMVAVYVPAVGAAAVLMPTEICIAVALAVPLVGETVSQLPPSVVFTVAVKGAEADAVSWRFCGAGAVCDPIV